MRKPKHGGGFPALWYTLRKGREAGGILRLHRALRAKNACKTCALGMGGQSGGMVNEVGHRFEVCKKSIQAMAADMHGRIRPHFFDDFSIQQLRGFTPRELEAAGRIVTPLRKGPLDDRYRAIEWDDAIDQAARALRGAAPEETFFYFSGRSSNEAGFLLQLLARLTGTNNVNNCSYYCHQASGVGLASATGSGTATVTLEDVERCDLLVLVGANPASNHPRFMKHIVEMRRRGGKVIVINPLREIGLERFKIPSDWRSMLVASRTSDLYLQPHIGGDIALLSLLAQRLLARNAVDDAFVREHANGFDAWRTHVSGLDAADLLARCGVGDAEVERAAAMIAASKRTIFCWAMGLTHHEFGVRNVQAVANLGLLRGMIGRPGCGLLPLRGHSNVQGIGSMGVAPQLKEEVAAAIERLFGTKLPTAPGLDTLSCMERARAGRIRFALCLGGNLYGSNPDARFAAEALNSIDTVVYLSTTLNIGHAWGTGRNTIVLPVLARDEEPEPTTQESMFNFVRLSDGGPRRYEGPRSEIEVVASLAESLRGDPRRPAIASLDWASMRRTRAIRDAIGQVIPGFGAMRTIDETKREFHIEGRTFHEPRFATPDGRARFNVVEPPPLLGTGPGELRLMTIRSEGQFNTVVYEDEDVYRGQDRRDVILMNEQDIADRGLRVDQRVVVRSAIGALENVLVRAFDLPPGNAAMYYPECNPIVPRTVDGASRTPAFKSVVVVLEPA